MNAVRFGSYSIRSTFAAIAQLSATLEVDDAVGLLVAAAAEADRDAAVDCCGRRMTILPSVSALTGLPL